MNMRGNSLKLLKRACKTQLRLNFLEIRREYVEQYAQGCASATSVNCFKCHFERQCKDCRYREDWKYLEKTTTDSALSAERLPT